MSIGLIDNPWHLLATHWTLWALPKIPWDLETTWHELTIEITLLYYSKDNTMSWWQLVQDHPILIGLLILYLSVTSSHHLLHLRFKIRGPVVGDKLLIGSDQKPKRFRIHYTEASIDAPLVIFESRNSRMLLNV